MLERYLEPMDTKDDPTLTRVFTYNRANGDLTEFVVRGALAGMRLVERLERDPDHDIEQIHEGGQGALPDNPLLFEMHGRP